MRYRFATGSVIVGAAMWFSPTAAAGPGSCDDPHCVPGIAAGIDLGAPCENTTTFVFGTTSWGRLVFCGSPRRYEPRYFRSPPMRGVKDESTSCEGFQNAVAQSPDGLFLSCSAQGGRSVWVRGDA
jgi:hypothetical protein